MKRAGTWLWVSASVLVASTLAHADSATPPADAPAQPQPAATAPTAPTAPPPTAAVTPQVVAAAPSPKPAPAAPRPVTPVATRAAHPAAAVAPPKVQPWIRTSNDEGILTFKREVPGSSIIALRGEGVVNAPIVRVASVVLDYRRAPEWVDSLEEARVIRMLSATEFVEYDHIGTPPIIMADRDFVCRGKVEVDLKQHTFTMNIWPTTDPAMPEGKYVRGRLSGYWKLKSIDNGTKTYVTTEMHGDPKGGIPKWLVNFFQKGWPHNTLESLREQVAKRDIKIIPEVIAVFEGKPLVMPTERARAK